MEIDNVQPKVSHPFSIDTLLSPLNPPSTTIMRQFEMSNINQSQLLQRPNHDATISRLQLESEILISQADSSNDWAELDESENGQDVDTTNSELTADCEVSSKEKDCKNIDADRHEDRKKRPRTAFTATQIKSLEAEFERSKYLSVSKRLQLSKTLRLSETQIKIWFQNRRTKWKRKYTNDLELLAQQYYSSMGVMAPRPIFLGDRLWFFNCSNVNGPVMSPSFLPLLGPLQPQQPLPSSISRLSSTYYPHQMASSFASLDHPGE